MTITCSTGALFVYGPNEEMLEKTDASGNAVSDYVGTLSYNNAGRLASISGSPGDPILPTK